MFITTQPASPDKRSQKIINLLQTVADNERQTHRLYADFLQSSHGISDDITDLCHTALHEDKSHFDEILACLKRLEAVSHSQQIKKFFFTPEYPLTTENLLQHLRDIEAFSVKAYNEICNISMEYDYQVFDLSYRNMNENLAHLDFVSNLLNNLHSGERL